MNTTPEIRRQKAEDRDEQELQIAALVCFSATCNVCSNQVHVGVNERDAYDVAHIFFGLGWRARGRYLRCPKARCQADAQPGRPGRPRSQGRAKGGAL
jgi:hypothetical protein